ncbi:MAG: SDR family NAD(P)-dependent oxidoreductase, partial [Planctomycetia bacterium]|nr:SDR family NAD(P)-dependent oxidoreductase [Planctomycetia bacterium]
MNGQSATGCKLKSSTEKILVGVLHVQKVLIIGAGGIGSAVAKEIVASGGRVFLAGRNSESLQKLSSELNCEWGTLEATDAA